MSRFLMPTSEAGRYQGWRRCDLCHWSGRAAAFITLTHDQDATDICTHDWCWGNEFVRQQLLADGWTLPGWES